MSVAVFVDFDDTATTQNAAHYLLNRFAPEESKRLRSVYLAGKITFREYQEEAFNAVTKTTEEMRAETGNPDFNVRSLRGTAVMRWEYRPGSTLFFVWTQQREGFDQFGDFDFNRDRSALFRDRATNVFQVKATYWLGR